MRLATLFVLSFGLAASGCALDQDDGRGPGGGGKADDLGSDGGTGDAGSDAEPEAANPFAAALDVDLPVIAIGDDVPVPDYDYPRADGFSLGGTEFWQKWSEGLNPTYSYEAGTEKGRKCMFASARRFEAIMANPPEALVKLRDETNWSGSFFNWNDDYSQSTWGDASAARLWAWRTTLIKWISQTAKNGDCFLPTRELVERAAERCLATAAGAAGEIQGCSVTAN